MADVVTCFVRERGEVLLTRRSDAVGTYRGRWAGVSGYVEGDPADAEADARRELREEVGLTDAHLDLVRAGEALSVDDAEGSFTVRPFLFESDTREVTPNEELAAVEWVDPTVVRERETVPRLWETWRRVGPTVADVEADRTHGSAWIAARALEALRDAAAEADADDWEAVASTARALREARPGMAAIGNRVNRVVADAGRAADGEDAAPTPASVVDRAIDALDAALAADEEAAATAVTRLRSAAATRLATLSRSGTVREAISRAEPSHLVVAESRPEREGVDVAEWAADATDAAVTLTTEAGLPTALERYDADAVLVGADSIRPDGSVANKTGTRILALAARSLGVPVYVVASRDKVQPAGTGGSDRDAPDERSPAELVYDGDRDVAVHAPTFEVAPATLLDGIATETGILSGEDVRAVAEEHAENARWSRDG